MSNLKTGAFVAKTPVSTQTLIKRIRRNLEKDGIALRTCREASRFHSELGDHYLIDIGVNRIIAKHCTLEGLGRELGVLAADEILADRQEAGHE